MHFNDREIVDLNTMTSGLNGEIGANLEAYFQCILEVDFRGDLGIVFNADFNAFLDSNLDMISMQI